MPNIRSPHLLRRLAWIAIETKLANWAWSNRARLLDTAQAQISRRRRTPDHSRPLGDRFVGPAADRGPTPQESAWAEAAPPLSNKVVDHLERSAAHVRIDEVDEPNVSNVSNVSNFRTPTSASI